MTTKKKLPDEVKDMLRGYSATFGTYTVKIGEEELGEYAPEFTLKNLNVGDLKSIQNDPGNDALGLEIIRKNMVGATNIFDYDSGEMIEFIADKNGSCSEEFFDKIPAQIAVTILHKMVDLNSRG